MGLAIFAAHDPDCQAKESERTRRLVYADAWAVLIFIYFFNPGMIDPDYWVLSVVCCTNLIYIIFIYILIC